MTVIQLNPPLEVLTPHGKGFALTMTDYGPMFNADFLVANSEDGKLRHYSTTQISLDKNCTHQNNN
jgi:hypothetical protein